MAHRTFGSSKTSTAKKEDITFDLATESDLLCRDYANGALLLELIGKVESGSVTQQSTGIFEIFDVVVETDDGDAPEQWTGRPFDADKPRKNHTQAELDALTEENQRIREQNLEIRERNKDVAEGKEPEEELPYVQPGIDPTSSLGRVRTILRDPRVRIEMDELVETVTWLVEQYTARPTQKSSGSRPGGLGTARSSRAARRSRAGTSENAVSAS